MKRPVLVLFLFSLSSWAIAQNSVSGKIQDGETGDALIGATILVKGTPRGTVTDWDGSFSLINVPGGNHTLVISYTGYTSEELDISVADSDLQIGSIELSSAVIGLSEVSVIASIAIDRKTPVAVSTIKGDRVEALVGNQEYPEILRKTPSIYVTKEGGGFGDSRINVRGFDQRNTAVMINGIPVNDMENGWVYWSNWAGLADVTSSLQVQRGLGASKLAVPSVGGSINIITNAADMQKGGIASIIVGNDGFYKYGLVLSTGLGEKGWAFTIQGTHTRGDGYVDGTMFRAWSYFTSVTKQFNKQHMLSITALGAPQWHNQRLLPSEFDAVNLRTFVDEDNTNEVGTGLGTRFNWYWGMKDGEEYNWRKNYYHKPKAFINHYWTISNNTDLKTSAYISLGRGGGTGPRGRIRSPGSIFDTFSGLGTGTHDMNGQVRFDDLVAYHQGQAIDGWGQKLPAGSGPLSGRYVATNNGLFMGNGAEGTGFIRRASANYHDWYGILSTLTHRINSSFNLVAGIDGRYYKGEHFRKVEDLLGNDAYMAVADKNNPVNYITQDSHAEFGNFSDDSFKKSNNVLNYWNDGHVSWLGLFGQLEYTSDQLSAFFSLAASNQGFKRIDYFNYLDSDPKQESDWENFLGGTIKAGLNYNINENHNIFANGGFFSKQPIFDNVFINFVNDVNEDVQNQTVSAIELGYGYRSKDLRISANLYSTTWGNRQFAKSFDNAEGQEILFQFENVKQNHIGFELEVFANPTYAIDLFGMLSIGDWKYTENFSARGTNIDTQQPEGERIIYADGLPVGDAAQTTFCVGAGYKVVTGLRVYADYYLADRLFADYDVNDSQFESPGGKIVQLPNYSLVDAGLSYEFPINGIHATFRLNVNNVFNKIYISELETNIPDDPATPSNEFYNNRGIFGFGRTYNMGLRVRF